MRITLYIVVVFISVGSLSKFISRRISDNCDWETYDFCADAGFAWEAVGAFLYLGAIACIFVVVLIAAIRFMRNRP